MLRYLIVHLPLLPTQSLILDPPRHEPDHLVPLDMCVDIFELRHMVTHVRDLLRCGVNLVSEALLLCLPCVAVLGEERRGGIVEAHEEEGKGGNEQG